MLPRERTPGHLHSATLRCPTHAQLLSGPCPKDAAFCGVPIEAARECALDMLGGAQLDGLARAPPPLPTGAPAFDALLVGGLRRGEVTELSGAPASGKTQVRRRLRAGLRARLTAPAPSSASPPPPAPLAPAWRCSG